ncbi:radical SAM family heme chaperone HemW [Lamprobacter modestohalophilus]|uniref:radical SAM family heme chaperone HemW n=1 Tax=Lamprobacter modestohalophilus TaxID=1064514 RepID=UPI002ADEE7C1|nr:radical SAM family heme chaperone HemW [Lamprobacter modestohalophilus]MEA1050399.1 radical SAM family heme chaperone HemW [Lamprobacter modestohalophilus]
MSRDSGCAFDAPPPLALYVHMPWCVRKCPYCDFNSHAVQGEMPEAAYIDALLRDLDAECRRLATGPTRPLISIFIGGGTPSLFSGVAIRRLLDGVRARFVLAPDAEITLEANPGTVDEAHFAGYAEAGVNRISIGVQSLSTDALERLGRIHTPDAARRAVAAARAAGITNINLDLMFALPGQDLSAARDDLERLIALEPTHLSYYELTLEPNTAFYQQPPTLPDLDLADAIQQQGFALLAAAGYERYEISAFAQTGTRCRHNLNYWRFGDYLGIGAGAHGKLSAANPGTVERRTKQRHPDAYLKACQNVALGVSWSAYLDAYQSANEPASQTIDLGANDPTSSVRTLSEQDLIEEFALNAFRLVDGFTSADFERGAGLRATALEPGLLASSELELVSQVDTGNQIVIRPTARGLAFLNDLVACFAGPD